MAEIAHQQRDSITGAVNEIDPKLINFEGGVVDPQDFGTSPSLNSQDFDFLYLDEVYFHRRYYRLLVNSKTGKAVLFVRLGNTDLG